MTEQLVLIAVTLGLFALFAMPWLLRARRVERESHVAREEAVATGVHEPVSLHPVIDPDRCIGSGGCVEACPEEVIGIRNGRAYALAPAVCVGHGLCERACPMQAITLVFGTATRGVELPRVLGDFQTNVPGLYIVGELGGMGLIRNAFEQARQAVAGMGNGTEARRTGMLDLAVIGCGPAGLAASLYAQQRGMRFATFEKEEDVGGAVRAYPRKKIVMAGTLAVPGYRKLKLGEVLKEELVDLWRDIIVETGLAVETGSIISTVRPIGDGGFEVLRADHEPVRAKRVVLALGRRGVPRRLGVPGENQAHVAHSLIDAEQFAGDRVLVVGGGDSAVEAALALCEQADTKVWLCYRGEALARVKPRNRERFDAAVGAGRIEPIFGANPVSLEAGATRIRLADESVVALPADRAFVLIGGELPTSFLKSCGVEIETRFGS